MACSDEETVPVTCSDDKTHPTIYIAPVEDRTHDLPHTVASNMDNNVVNYYDVSVLSMSVMGSKKQFGWGWVGGWSGWVG